MSEDQKTNNIQLLIVEYYRQSRQGIVAYDIAHELECMFFFNIFSQLHDNPMLCECSSHVGLQGNYFCPRCKAGGSKEFKSSDDGFESLFQVRKHMYICFKLCKTHGLKYIQPRYAEPRKVDETQEEVL